MALINSKRTDAELLRIEGDILDGSTYDALAIVTDADIEQLPQHWGRVVPERYKHILDAEDAGSNP